MSTTFPVKGYWFLPDQEENKLAGILNTDGDRFRLELFGSFKGNSQEDFLKSIEWEKSDVTPMIYGYGSDGKYYSLINNISGASSLNFGADFPLTSFLSDDVIDGCLLDEPAESAFTRIQAEYSHLQEWLGFTGISAAVRERSGITLNYQYPETVTIPISDHISLSFKYKYDYNGPNRYQREIRQTCFVEFKSETPVSYQTLCRSLYLFQDFLSLATLSEIFIVSTTVFCKMNSENTDELPERAELYLSPPHSVALKEKPFFKFLFQYDDVKDALPDVLTKWFAIEKDMWPIRKYLIESIKPTKIFEANHFLNVVQALEGFYSRFHKEEKIFKVWFANLLEDFNKIDLINQEFSDKDGITTAAKDSRHYYSHLYKLRNDQTKEGKELYYLTKKLRLLLICCVLREIGMEDATINKVLQKEKL